VPISYRGAGRPPEQGRCALHRAHGGGAHRAGPCAAARAGARRCRAALQNCAGHGARFFHAAATRSGARRFNRARAHIPGTDHASPSGRPRAPHAAVPSAALHLPGHFANCQAPKISVLRILLTVTTPYPADMRLRISIGTNFEMPNLRSTDPGASAPVPAVPVLTKQQAEQQAEHHKYR
jgi:hypothetical protein